jgi:hypothetical protein
MISAEMKTEMIWINSTEKRSEQSKRTAEIMQKKN